jgi:hypothetical protein
MEQLAMLLDGHLDDAISSKRFFVTSGRPKVHFWIASRCVTTQRSYEGNDAFQIGNEERLGTKGTNLILVFSRFL